VGAAGGLAFPPPADSGISAATGFIAILIAGVEVQYLRTPHRTQNRPSARHWGRYSPVNCNPVCSAFAPVRSAPVFGSGVFLSMRRTTRFSTWLGRPGLYLEDLFVTQAARGKGVGRRLMTRLAAIAVERGWERIDFQVLDWNPSRAWVRAAVSSSVRSRCMAPIGVERAPREGLVPMAVQL
jgi:GNAT superfamily N-acetyltransferase